MLSFERAAQLFIPDFKTGALIWKFNHQRPDLIGKRAGWINEGYWRVSVDGATYYCCQIIWLLARREFPVKTVDHKNGKKLDDSLNNLRLATKAQNAANSKINSRNSTGLKGVSFCKSTNKYRADICIDGVRKNLGRFLTPEEAHETWLAAAKQAFGSEFVRAA